MSKVVRACHVQSVAKEVFKKDLNRIYETLDRLNKRLTALERSFGEKNLIDESNIVDAKVIDTKEEE
jgi:hypothetical protein